MPSALCQSSPSLHRNAFLFSCAMYHLLGAKCFSAAGSGCGASPECAWCMRGCQVPEIDGWLQGAETRGCGMQESC